MKTFKKYTADKRQISPLSKEWGSDAKATAKLRKSYSSGISKVQYPGGPGGDVAPADNLIRGSYPTRIDREEDVRDVTDKNNKVLVVKDRVQVYLYGDAKKSKHHTDNRKKGVITQILDKKRDKVKVKLEDGRSITINSGILKKLK